MDNRQHIISRRLTPVRVVAICMLVLAALSLNELERLAIWFGDRCTDWLPGAEAWCGKPEELVFSSNAKVFSSQLLEMEKSVLAFTHNLPVLAASKPDTVKVAALQATPRPSAAPKPAAPPPPTLSPRHRAPCRRTTS
ncbi:MAG: hypothetical protein HZT40_21365 [Candidatus Thiothrix singaporensis]|uniref:Uncharacterized protein n=1 Tax=Candidatus Thiothrix singaporensis TaxID=2799669 RepID=A0A7L6AXD8_9GAMM|nr:MAG: hypothetical protein HZT40_21365 [Candidatus Thiothrix singaporensis]